MGVLALDCGNNFLQIVAALDNEKGKIVPLQDPNHPEGFLSYISWDGKRFMTGYELANSRRFMSTAEGLLKNRLAENITLKCAGSKEEIKITGKEALRFVVKEAIQRAIKVLQEVYHEECTGVALAYPASWLGNQRLNLIRTLEGLEINDKLKLHITGTISEPAAGGLSFANYIKDKAESNVLVIDVGAGTTDVSIVHVIPEGKKDRNGRTYYYDIIATDGLPNIAGSNFTAAMADLLRRKITSLGANAPKIAEFLIQREAEHSKIALTEGMSAEPGFIGNDGMFLDIKVTRAEYEKEIAPLVQKIVECATHLRSLHPGDAIGAVVLTGGGSQVPLIMSRVREAFSDIPKERIEAHDPSMAIARGAATYAIDEGGVIQRTTYDIAIEYYENGESDHMIAHVYIPAGTQLPVERTATLRTSTRFDGSSTISPIMEAKTLTPDPNKPRQDYTEIYVATYDFGHNVPAGTVLEEYMSVDKNNILHYFVNDPFDSSRKTEEATIRLLHIGEGD